MGKKKRNRRYSPFSVCVQAPRRARQRGRWLRGAKRRGSRVDERRARRRWISLDWKREDVGLVWIGALVVRSNILGYRIEEEKIHSISYTCVSLFLFLSLSFDLARATVGSRKERLGRGTEKKGSNGRVALCFFSTPLRKSLAKRTTNRLDYKTVANFGARRRPLLWGDGPRRLFFPRPSSFFFLSHTGRGSKRESGTVPPFC